MRCRKCKSVECNLSRRSAIECMVGQILPLRPYRCSACHTRFWGLNRLSLSIRRVAIAGFGLFLFLWFLAGIFLADKRPLTIQPATPAGNQASVKVNVDNTTVVKTEGKITSPSKVLKSGQQDPRVALDIADSPVLNASRLTPASDFVKIPPERNRKRKPGATPVISFAIESEPVSTKTKKPISDPISDKVVVSVDSRIPKKKPLPPGRLHLERMSMKHTGGATLVLHTNRRIENHTFLRIEGPARMVVDLPGNWSLSKQIQLLIVVEDDLVEKIRLGQSPDNLRIVFDLGNTPINEPLFESKANSLEITLVAQ